jgi:hypothetical protein
MYKQVLLVQAACTQQILAPITLETIGDFESALYAHFEAKEAHAGGLLEEVQLAVRRPDMPMSGDLTQRLEKACEDFIFAYALKH